MNIQEMAVSRIASNIVHHLKGMWYRWSFQSAVLASLFFQILLFSIAPLRKCSGRGIVTWSVWGVYLVADSLAAFPIGNLMSISQRNSSYRVNIDIALLWVSFLLLHLGGPDTVTALSQEDNELWLRHLLYLLLRLPVSFLVFFQSVPNELWIPILLALFVGSIKYAERTCAMYFASSFHFKKSRLLKIYAQLTRNEPLANSATAVNLSSVPKIVIKKITTATTTTTTTTKPNITDIEVVQIAYKCCKIFDRLIVGLNIFSPEELLMRKVFSAESTWEEAFRIMEVELNFMYDELYTKMAMVHCKIGFLVRFLCFVLIGVSFALFASHHKHQVEGFDLVVTYILLVGTVGLELAALFQLVFSDWTIALLENHPHASKIVSKIRERLSFGKRPRRWSNSASQHSLIGYCLKERCQWFDKAADFFGLKDLLHEMLHKTTCCVEDDLKEFIFTELKGKAFQPEDEELDIAKEIFSSVGAGKEFDYDESLLVWHIATELCYFASREENNHTPLNRHREFSKILSEYMLYLLVMRPKMMSEASDAGRFRFWDTCDEARDFFGKQGLTHRLDLYDVLLHICPGRSFYKTLEKYCFFNFLATRRNESKEKQKLACEKLLSKYSKLGEIERKPLLFDACMLAKKLRNESENNMWETMSKVWVELLYYAASTNHKANAHAEQLNKGGEFITFVWLLMAHLGLEQQFWTVKFDAHEESTDN